MPGFPFHLRAPGAGARPRVPGSPGFQCPVPVPSPGRTCGLGPYNRKTPPFPVAYSFPRLNAGVGREGDGLRKLINPVHFRPPGGGAGRAAAVAGTAGGRRCRPGRNFTLQGRRLAASARSLVPGSLHPLAPALGRSLRVPAGEETPPPGLEKPAASAVRVPLLSQQPRASPIARSTLRVLAAAPRGSGWKLTEHDPPPKPGRRVARGPAARRGRRGLVASPPPESPPAAPEPCRVRSGRWDGKRWAHEV